MENFYSELEINENFFYVKNFCLQIMKRYKTFL